MAFDVRVKRAYDPAAANDGWRVLVDRVWPRGVRKEELDLDAWRRELAPSSDLRRWFHADRERWPDFRERYFRELDAGDGAVDALCERVRRGRVTLVYGSRDPQRNNAVALREYLRERLRGRS